MLKKQESYEYRETLTSTFPELTIDKIYKGERQFCISPEVKQALGTLEKVISMVRKFRKANNNNNASSSSEEEVLEVQDPSFEVLDEASFTHYLNNNNNRRSGSSSFGREGNKIAHASNEIDLSTNSDVTRITISQATTLFSQTTEYNNEKQSGIAKIQSGIYGGKGSVLRRKRKPGCFGFRSWMKRTLKNWVF